MTLSINRIIAALPLAAALFLCAAGACVGTKTGGPAALPVKTGRADAVHAVKPDSATHHAAAPDTSAEDTAADDQETEDSVQVADDPSALIEQAKTLCTQGKYAEADSNLKEAVKSIETIDAENEGNEEWFPSSRYLDDIVSIYSEKMPQPYSIPEDLAMAAFQHQMMRSVDSLNVFPPESLSQAAFGCQKGLTYDVPMVWNERVQRALYFYLKNRKGTVDRWFGRAASYVPVMRKMFSDSGLPQDLAYLPLIESGFNPLAYSYAHASGIWQFISETGRVYGLRHTYWIDERRDPLRSTVAAIRYLKILYAEFGHWHLALAAYNCGENGIARSISRCRTNDYWRLSMPRETKSYVPCYLAALTIAKNPKCFGVVIPPPDTCTPDTVEVSDCISLVDIAGALGVTYDTLKQMNPHILRWCTPPDVTGSLLYLPHGKRQAFGEFSAQLIEEKKVKWCRYQVKQGDNIQIVASRFHISADGIKAINRLQKNKLSEGQFLYLPLPSAAGAPVVAYIPPELPKDDDDFGTMTRCRISRGDCLSRIARKYHVSVNQLCRLNRITRNTPLRAGRLLIVRYAPHLAATTAPAATATPATATPCSTYVVRMGDTPFSIARKTGIKPTDLAAWNNLDATQPVIRINDTLRLTENKALMKIKVINDTAQQKPKQPPVAVAAVKTDSGKVPDPSVTAAPAKDSVLGWSAALADKKPLDAAAQAPKRYYTVQSGDNLFRIALRFSVSLDKLMTANNLRDSAVVRAGDSLLIPAADAGRKTGDSAEQKKNIVFYTVRNGDTLWRIASEFGVAIGELYKANNLKPDSVIVPGDVIKVVKAGDL